jgi:SAM-dependent methyltransferase
VPVREGIDAPVDHEKSYRGLSVRSLAHRARLRAIVRAIALAAPGPEGRLGDFGCSNGFILAELRAGIFRDPRWELWGFDHAPPYVEAARARGIPGARFEAFDLDAPGATPPVSFDLALCLETLEHTANFRNGLAVLARSVRPGGHVLITVPNERGLPGLLKFFGRKALRGATYDAFFQGRPQGPYLRALLTGGDLEPFRQPPRHGWGDHLGFDVRGFEAHLHAEYTAPGRLDLVMRRRTSAGLGRLYLLRRPTSS